MLEGVTVLKTFCHPYICRNIWYNLYTCLWTSSLISLWWLESLRKVCPIAVRKRFKKLIRNVNECLVFGVSRLWHVKTTCSPVLMSNSFDGRCPSFLLWAINLLYYELSMAVTSRSPCHLECRFKYILSQFVQWRVTWVIAVWSPVSIFQLSLREQVTFRDDGVFCMKPTRSIGFL